MDGTKLKAIKEKMTQDVLDGIIQIGHMGESEKAAYRQELASKIKSRTLCTDPREQSGLTNAYDYNKTAYELYLDILTVFSYLNELDESIDRHQKLNQGLLGSIESTIGALNDRLDEAEAVMGTVGHPECWLDNLRTDNGREADKSFYKERYGEIVNSAAYALYNPGQETITLNYTRRQNVLMYKSGVQLGEASITKQYGAGFIKARNAEEKLNNALDTSTGSYWAETILCDSEMKIKGSGFEDPATMHQYNRSFYDLPKGALCEICIRFEALTKVNELILNPFGSFPFDVVAVRYTISDSEDAECHDILTPDGSANEWLVQTTLRKEHCFHFPDIVCKKLYILINQLHCIKDTFLISSDQMFKNELWFNATNPEAESAVLPNTTVFKPNYIDQAKEDPVWLYINNKMDTLKDIDINQLLIESKNRLLPCTKYQYTYGFRNIIPNYSEYQNTSVYVTEKIQASGIIKSIKLYTEEEHFKSLDNGRQVTDIEYYVTTKKEPSYLDWLPVCPVNKTHVYAERLQLDYDVCYLLYPAVCRRMERYDEDGHSYFEMIRPVIRQDDQVLTENEDYILHFDDSMNAVSVEIANLDNFAMYTAEYTPAEDSFELDLIQDDHPVPNNSFETIDGTGASSYELEDFPYYSHNDPKSTNTYVKIINIQTGEVSAENGNIKVKCVTDKLNPDAGYKNMSINKAGTALTGVIEYYTSGKRIYFNRPITAEEKIEVSYPSFGSSVRMKIILRKNSKRDFWMTPVLHNWKLEFTTI